MVTMGDSDVGALTAPDEPHTRTLLLSVVRGMSEINRHMMEMHQAQERLCLELRHLRMLEIKLPPEMET